MYSINKSEVFTSLIWNVVSIDSRYFKLHGVVSYLYLLLHHHLSNYCTHTVPFYYVFYSVY